MIQLRGDATVRPQGKARFLYRFHEADKLMMAWFDEAGDSEERTHRRTARRTRQRRKDCGCRTMKERTMESKQAMPADVKAEPTQRNHRPGEAGAERMDISYIGFKGNDVTEGKKRY